VRERCASCAVFSRPRTDSRHSTACVGPEAQERAHRDPRLSEPVVGRRRMRTHARRGAMKSPIMTVRAAGRRELGMRSAGSPGTAIDTDLDRLGIRRPDVPRFLLSGNGRTSAPSSAGARVLRRRLRRGHNPRNIGRLCPHGNRSIGSGHTAPSGRSRSFPGAAIYTRRTDKNI